MSPVQKKTYTQAEIDQIGKQQQGISFAPSPPDTSAQQQLDLGDKVVEFDWMSRGGSFHLDYIERIRGLNNLALEAAELLGVEPTTPFPVLRDRVLGSIRSLKAGNR